MPSSLHPGAGDSSLQAVDEIRKRELVVEHLGGRKQKLVGAATHVTHISPTHSILFEYREPGK